jgi:hypothetical protein
MVLNATNYDRLAEKFGDETDDWGGKDLVLFTELTRNPQGATDAHSDKAGQQGAYALADALSKLRVEVLVEGLR